MKKSRLSYVVCSCVLMFLSAASIASPAKFNIPGDFPGLFQIDFLGTGFYLDGNASGSLSTASVIQFSVGSEIAPDSGIYDIAVSPGGFSFIGFEPIAGLPFDVYGAGTGNGTFDTNTGEWIIDMPTLWVNQNSNGTSYGTRLDFHLTTADVYIDSSVNSPAYTSTYGSPMVLEDIPEANWGDLNLVAGGIVPSWNSLSLEYDSSLIAAIGSSYTNFIVDTDPFVGIQYEFNIYGNDPLQESSIVPIPAAVWLFNSGLLGLIGIARRKKAV